jgi:hypothetical protein
MHITVINANFENDRKGEMSIQCRADAEFENPLRESIKFGVVGEILHRPCGLVIFPDSTEKSNAF